MSDKYNGNYPGAWSQSDIDFYLSMDKEPAKTSNGIWVGDVQREQKDLVDWSMAELYALASGELYTTKLVGDGPFYKAVRGKALLEDSDALRWGEEDLMEWLLHEKTPARSPGGFYINDPERWTKDAANWHTPELVDLGLGYFGGLERSHEYILDEISDRFELPLGITFADFSLYIEKGIKPPQTLDGVLINDRHRAGKPTSDWTEAELEGWVRGEIESSTQGLLQKAIDQFGGEWYWDIEALKTWVISSEVPTVVHNYGSYTDEQLQSLIDKENDQGALEELTLVRHPKPEPEPEPIEEEAVVEQPVEEEVTHEVLVQQYLEEWTGSDEIVQEEEAAIVEAVAEPEYNPLWTDLVREGTPLYTSLVADTPVSVIEDTDRRRVLSASKWTAEELVGWARGLIPGALNTSTVTLMAVLRGLCGAFVSNWTDDAVISFIVSQELPKGFKEGVLVEDIVRDQKHPGSWTDDEFIAWANGNILTIIDPKQVLFSMRVRMKIPDRLNDGQAMKYVASGVMPVDEVPPIEAGKNVSERQLLAWLKNELKLDDSFDTTPLFDLVRSMYRIDVHWTDDCIIGFYRHGNKPAVLEDGTLVNDRLRDLNSPANWSWKELRHLEAGMIHANFTLEEAESRIRRLIDVQFGVPTAHWGFSEVVSFLVTESKPKSLVDGVFVNDPTRKLKELSNWRDAELKAWLRGEIELPEKHSDEEVWTEVYARFKIPLFWYREDAKTYALTGVEVKALPSGLWVRDINRDARPARHWTRREIKAWARGQIVPGIKASENELAQQAIKLFGLSVYLDLNGIKSRVSAITEESITMTISFVLQDLESYEKGRKDTEDNPVAAAPFQSMLDRCINRVIRLEGEDFNQGWTELLKFFHKNQTGCCSLKKAYTGVGQMAITPKGLRQFQNMTTILIRTCDPTKAHAATKLINWEVALKEVTNEKSRQQLLAYYGIQ
jgi:hypothetical protein